MVRLCVDAHLQYLNSAEGKHKKMGRDSKTRSQIHQILSVTLQKIKKQIQPQNTRSENTLKELVVIYRMQEKKSSLKLKQYDGSNSSQRYFQQGKPQDDSNVKNNKLSKRNISHDENIIFVQVILIDRTETSVNKYQTLFSLNINQIKDCLDQLNSNRQYHQLSLINSILFTYAGNIDLIQLYPKQYKLNASVLRLFMTKYRYLVNLMNNLNQLNESFQHNKQKVLNIEETLRDLKQKMIDNSNIMKKYSSYWLKQLMNNQINKQILMHSFELKNEVYLENLEITKKIQLIQKKLNKISCRFNSSQVLIEACKEVLFFLQIQNYNKFQNDEQNINAISQEVNNLMIFLKQYNTVNEEDKNNFIDYLDAELQGQQRELHFHYQQNFRMRVAFAGVNQDVLSHYLAIQGKYQDDQILFNQQNTGLIALSVIMGLATTKLPGIDLITLGGVGIVQTFLNFSNPYRTLSADIREQCLSMTQLTTTGGFGLAGAFLGQAIIPLPFLGAVVGGLLMEFIGVFISNTIKNKTNENCQEDLINFFVKNNMSVKQSNVEKYCEVLGIKRDTFQHKIQLPRQHSIHRLVSMNNTQINYVKDDDFNNQEVEKVQLYLLFALQILGQQIFTTHKESLGGNSAFNQVQQLQTQMLAFTEYFDFNFLSIGKNLYIIYYEMKNQITVQEISALLEQIEVDQIEGNNDIVLNAAPIKKYCQETKLKELLISKGINPKLIDDLCPKSIMNIDSLQKMDLWCTYICIQLINPSYVFLDIFMMKINFLLEQKNIFFIDAIDSYFPVLKEMYTEQ